MLVEFASAVDAVTCAMGVQGKMAERNDTGAPQIAFRIGINVGDIIIEGDDIFGDGINIAARVENECEPGRVYLSDDAFRQVRGKTAFAFDDIGERTLKNIDQPVRIYAVRPHAERSGASGGGVVEAIITGLSQFSSLFVIARNSSFTYKGRTVDVKQVGRELGVRYVLEGSVRKSGSRVRITGQLIE